MKERILFVDDDPNILDAYQRKLQHALRVRTAEGPLSGLQEIKQKGPFAVVICPFNAFMHLYRDEDVQTCLEEVRRVLDPEGGRFVFDAYLSRDEAEADERPAPGEPWSFLVSVLDADLRAEVYEREEPADGRRTFVMAYRYKVYRGDQPQPEIVEERIRHHLLPPRRVEELLKEAGFDVIEMWGEFDRRPRRLYEAILPSMLILRRPFAMLATTCRV